MTRNPNRMQEAVDLLQSKFAVNAGVVVSYSRGAVVLTGITATVGRTPFEVSDGQVMLGYESRDYMILKADIDPWIPHNGDLVTEANGRVYEVAMPKPMNVYESMGPDGTVFKIHTKGPR